MANFVANLQQTKKRKLEDENRMFQTRWTFEYFFIENTDKRPLCLICKQTVNATKEGNVKRHYKTMHSKDVYGKLAVHNRELKVKQLQEKLKIQRSMIRKMHSDSEKAVRCSYLIALRIAKSMKPYSDGNLVKQCIMDIAQEMCPKMKCEFEKISMSWWTITKRIDDLASDISDTLRDKAKSFVSWSFAMDESTDQKDTAQLAIFVKGVDKELNERASVTAVNEGYDNWC
ncbi:general transcription factor II-I repeat domain-containing protein 2-like [Clavelina lepadiformis]|uniref:general transcription factor II-I repeat domain-containing protein 2-like n=1 Tax=Clavelina lepadiformis TaxID=159417 RepID=UPI004041A80F